MATENVSAKVQRGRLFRAAAPGASFRQRLTHAEAGLEWLDCGEFLLPPGAGSQAFSFPGREGLLWMWKGAVEVRLGEEDYGLGHYDVLYVPLGAAFRLKNPGPDPAVVVATTAPAANAHPAHLARYAEVARREERIRRLKGKDVYLMFDVSEAAERLVGGYTFFQPFQRSWPPHNHTDQEEVYIFTRGRGAMEVYEAPESLSFVVEVSEGDIVSIPRLNYHPVFSQEEPLEFIWCIAGARYWVGDKAREFMQGGSKAITT